MTRDRIKSRASLKGEVWPGRKESVEYGGKKIPWSGSHNADSEGSGPVFGEESGFMMIAVDTTSWLSHASLMAAESPAGSRIPSSDLVMCSGSKARAGVGATNPLKIKSPWISAT